jgi:hypothetical protein
MRIKIVDKIKNRKSMYKIKKIKWLKKPHNTTDTILMRVEKKEQIQITNYKLLISKMKERTSLQIPWTLKGPQKKIMDYSLSTLPPNLMTLTKQNNFLKQSAKTDTKRQFK